MHWAGLVRRGVSLWRFLPLLMLLVGGSLFLLSGGERYLSVSALIEHREFLIDWVGRAGAAAPLCFIAVYAGLTALSVPGAALLSIAAGILFGSWAGTLYAVTGATLGATAVFAATRAGFGNAAERVGPWAGRLEVGFRAHAFNYLLVLRLIPVFPFCLINLAAALTRITLRTYVAGTFLGIIPGCFVFVSFGTAFSDFIGTKGSPDLDVVLHPSTLVAVGGLVVLALMPVALKRYRLRQ